MPSQTRLPGRARRQQGPRLLSTLLTALFAASLLPAARAAEPAVTVKSLKILAVIYRGAPGDARRLSDTDVQGIRNGFALARLFYFRNTQCRLNLDFTCLVADSPAPNDDGPTYEHIVADLRSRGVKDNQYDGIVATSNGFHGNWGGFKEMGRMGAAFGIAERGDPLGWYPENDPVTWYGVSWIVVHEFQHALDSPIATDSGHPELLSGHPYSDSMEGYFTYGHHAGQHWDWEAHTLRSFSAWNEIRGATDSSITTRDSDEDGLPDDEPSLPMDEKRFGSDPSKKDTDGDGLNDLDEFCADIYRGSDPLKTDTDGDGAPDGKDTNPTVALAPSVRYAAAIPIVDGKMDEAYAPLMLAAYVDNSPSLARSRLFACWNEDGLSLFLKSPERCILQFNVDTSGENGFWEGGDTYTIVVKPDGSVEFGELNPRGPVPGAKAVWGADGLEVAIPALIGQGVSGEINFGGRRRPEDTTDGMVLLPGRIVSFNAFVASGSQKALFTPNWSMFDTVLEKPADAPSKPTLRFNAPLTNAAVPTVQVEGVRPAETVEIRAGGKVVGARRGSGKVLLTGRLAEGPNTLTAHTGPVASAPFVLTVDRKAAPPKAVVSRDGITITGEPGATVTLYAGTGGHPVWPVHSVVLDAKGQGTAPLTPGTKGWTGLYSETRNWDPVKFWRIDPEIRFDYNDGSPDPRMHAEPFSIRWTGYLSVPQDGDYTFYLTTDDGSRVWVDGVKAADAWGHHGVEEPRQGTVTLTKGEHEIRVDYYEEYGWAAAHLEWSGPGITRTHALPVTPWPRDVKDVQFFARQTDVAGNTSGFSTAAK
jgi:hypothetical protein